MQAIDIAVATETRRLQNYVNGAWATLETSEWLPVTNPASGAVVAQVPLSTAREVDHAVTTAHDAFQDWRSVPPLERAQFMFALRERMVRHRAEIARLITTEHGKTLADANGSVQRAIENVEVASGMPSLLMGYGLENGAGSGIDEEAVRRPLGVFSAVAPFNFPMMVPFWFLPYAITTGNTFIVKPSELVPLSQAFVMELIDQIALPKGVVNLLNGSRATVQAILDHPLVRGISFVGSTAVAKDIYARAAANGKRVQASGGAKNVLVVMPDADLDSVIPNIINSAFGSSGQRCLAGSVVLPIGDARKPLKEALVAAIGKIKVGDGMDESVTMGPVISAQARDRILAAVQGAIRDGAELVVGGSAPSIAGQEGGYFVEPTLLDGASPDMPVAHQEVFGPVLTMIPMDSLPEALNFIQSTAYGNAASIFTESGGLAREFVTRADVGNVGVNIGVAAPMAYFPFGGAKDSFFGTQHGQGRDAIDFFTDRRIVISRWFTPSRESGRHW